MASTCTYCDHFGGYLAWDDDLGEIPMCAHCYGEPHEDEPCTLPSGERAHFDAEGNRRSGHPVRNTSQRCAESAHVPSWRGFCMRCGATNAWEDRRE